MAEKVCECKVLMVHYVCDECGQGVMKRVENSYSLTVYPPQYTHECENCGNITNFPIIYPYQTMVPIECLRDREEGED